MSAQGRLLHSNWDLYDTRHSVFRAAKLTGEQLETGYWRAYRDFYRWGSILRGAWSKPQWAGRLRHFGYATGWKKFEPLWDIVIRCKRVGAMLPLLESLLEAFGSKSNDAPSASPTQVGPLRHPVSPLPI